MYIDTSTEQKTKNAKKVIDSIPTAFLPPSGNTLRRYLTLGEDYMVNSYIGVFQVLYQQTKRPSSIEDDLYVLSIQL